MEEKKFYEAQRIVEKIEDINWEISKIECGSLAICCMERGNFRWSKIKDLPEEYKKTLLKELKEKRAKLIEVFEEL